MSTHAWGIPRRVAIVTLAMTSVLVVSSAAVVGAQATFPLRGVRAVRVTETDVASPEKVKLEQGPLLVQEALQTALNRSQIESGEAPIRAHIRLEEFGTGNSAKRLLVGFGSGRATIKGRLVIADSRGQSLASVPFEVRGRLLFSAYQGAGAQQGQVLSNLEKKLVQAIATLR